MIRADTAKLFGWALECCLKPIAIAGCFVLVALLPKIKLELVLKDETVEPAVSAIVDSAFTGKIGDGKIFLYKLDDAIRIRSKERGTTAI